MKNFARRFLICIVCIAMVVTCVHATTLTASADINSDIADLQQKSKEIQAEINRLKKNKSDQSAILAAIQKKIYNTQAQINRCNNEISNINAKISANKAEIDAKNKEIDANKLAFKKRIRAIYMSNSDSSVKILMGAENFADFLQLAQMTSVVSAHDKAIIEGIVAAIELLNAKNAENQKLLDSQIAIRSTIQSQQSELEAQENEAEKIYNGIAAQQKDKEQDKKENEAILREKIAYLESIANSANSGGSFINSKTGFMWPVPGFMKISSYWGTRWGTFHSGIDIAQGGIFGARIVAMTDGVVIKTYNSCPHTDKKSRCRCGSGWGNHVTIDHGTINGARYQAVYAHMNSTAVSVGQQVKQGQTIGYVGTTGDSTGYHLHLTLIKNGSRVDPLPYLK